MLKKYNCIKLRRLDMTFKYSVRKTDESRTAKSFNKLPIYKYRLYATWLTDIKM